MDDKAYVRPSCDVGFRTTTKGRILNLTDAGKERVLPQHDFPIKEMNQIPSSFRVMT